MINITSKEIKIGFWVISGAVIAVLLVVLILSILRAKTPEPFRGSYREPTPISRESKPAVPSPSGEIKKITPQVTYVPVSTLVPSLAEDSAQEADSFTNSVDFLTDSESIFDEISKAYETE